MIKKLINKILRKPSTSIPFGTGLDLTDLPVCTFQHGGRKFNFVLDTGSSDNILDIKAFKKMQAVDTNKEVVQYGVDGLEQILPVHNITISYKGTAFNDSFCIRDMSQAFSLLKKETGVTLHGLLGSSFFRKFEYVLDFAELVAYSKKS